MNCATDQRLLFGASPHCTVWLPECPVPVAGYVEHVDGVSTVVALSDLAVVEVNRLRVRRYVLSESDKLTCGVTEIEWKLDAKHEVAEGEYRNEISEPDGSRVADVDPIIDQRARTRAPSMLVDRPFVQPILGRRRSLGRVLGKIAESEVTAGEEESCDETPVESTPRQKQGSDQPGILRRAA